jgi:hypothetical protein
MDKSYGGLTALSFCLFVTRELMMPFQGVHWDVSNEKLPLALSCTTHRLSHFSHAQLPLSSD